MIKIQSLLLLFFINICFSQHIHENIQWNNTTEPENENKNNIIGVFNNFYVDYEKEKFSNSYVIFETHHFKNKLSNIQSLELVNLISTKVDGKPGGGRPDMAQSGGQNVKGVQNAINFLKKYLINK